VIQAHLWNGSDQGTCLTLQGRLLVALPVSGHLEFPEPGVRGTRRSQPNCAGWTPSASPASSGFACSTGRSSQKPTCGNLFSIP